MGTKLDITGEVYGYAKAIRNTGEKYRGSYIWECECLLCGKKFTAKIRNIREGSVKSCGCLTKRNLTTMGIKEKLGQIEGTNVSRITSNSTPKNNKCGHRGVSLHQQRGRKDVYIAYIYFQGVRYHLGSYRDVNDAIKARQEAEKRLYTDFYEWYKKSYPDRWEKFEKRTKKTQDSPDE